MKDIIIMYLFIGVVVNLGYDILVSWLTSVDSTNKKLRFTIGERISFGLLWPISAVVATVASIRTLIKIIKDRD
jgi:hypothetical protein